MAEPAQDPDPMTETTRKMRRMLLVVASLLLLLRAVPEMEPKTIPALGIEFVATGQNGGPVIGAMLLIAAYLLVAFVWYAIRDVRFRAVGGFFDTAHGKFSVGAIVPRLVKFRGPSWAAVEPRTIGPQLSGYREQERMGKVAFARLVCRVYLLQAFELIVDRVTVFWVLDFWFPVVVATLALWGNGGPAIDLIYRVGASF